MVWVMGKCSEEKMFLREMADILTKVGDRRYIILI